MAVRQMDASSPGLGAFVLRESPDCDTVLRRSCQAWISPCAICLHPEYTIRVRRHSASIWPWQRCSQITCNTNRKSNFVSEQLFNLAALPIDNDSSLKRRVSWVYIEPPSAYMTPSNRQRRHRSPSPSLHLRIPKQSPAAGGDDMDSSVSLVLHPGFIGYRLSKLPHPQG